MEAIANISLSHEFITRLVLSAYPNGNIKLEAYMENIKVGELTEDSETLLPEGILAIVDTPFTNVFLETLLKANIIRCYVPTFNGSRKIYLCGLTKVDTVSNYKERGLIAYSN